MIRIRLTTSVAAAIACLALAFGGTAVAQQTPADDTYGGLAAEQQASSTTGNPGDGDDSSTPGSPVNTSADDSNGSLPFTGFQLGIALVAGAALLGTGFVVRRSVRPASRA